MARKPSRKHLQPGEPPENMNDNLLLGLYCVSGDPDFGLTTPLRYALPGDYVHLVSPSVTGSLLKQSLVGREPDGRLVVTDAGRITLAANAPRLEWLFGLFARR
jgi:hypothetical protein